MKHTIDTYSNVSDKNRWRNNNIWYDFVKIYLIIVKCEKLGHIQQNSK